MRDQVDEVKQKTDIVAIVGEQIKLTKAGRNYRGLCPFHNEKTPSFMVSPELQIYKCFGCGESGDVFTFLEKTEGMEFYDALNFLADKAGIKLKRVDAQKRSESQELIKINSLARDLYHFLLTKHPLGKPGLEYLTKTRGISKEVIETFKLGFAPDKPNTLFNYATSKKGIKPDVLDKAGLVYKTQRGFVDRFRGRVVFPISDHNGNVVAFGGRILPEYDNGRAGKYINSPETPVYHKSRSLYGLDITKSEIRERRTAVLVEGEMDFLSSWQAGVKNIVAIKGTALTQDHIRILSRFADTLIFALDTDFAGDNAAIRGFTIAQNAGLELKIADMGDYKDPDEFARADKKEYEKAIENAVDAMKFVIDTVVKKYDVSKGTGKAKVSQEVIPLVAHISDDILKAHYVAQIAQRLNVPVEAVMAELRKKQQGQSKNPPPSFATTQPKKRSRKILLEERLLILGLVSDYNDLISDEVGGLLSSQNALKIYDHIQNFILKNKKVTLGKVASSLPTESRDYFFDLTFDLPEEKQEALGEYNKVKKELKILFVKQEMDKVSRDISNLEEQGDSEALTKVQHQFQKLALELSSLEEE